MKANRLLAAGILVAVLAVAASGCGDSGGTVREPAESTTAPGASSTHAADTTDPTASTIAPEEPTMSTTPSTSPTPPTPSTAPPSGEVDPALSAYVQLAVADLATRLGASAEDIVVLSATLTTWPNSALGCPRPGMQYLQVVTDGSRIELQFDGATYRYHAGGNRTPFLCEQPARPPAIAPVTPST